MNRTHFPRSHIALVAAALALSLIWAALSPPASPALIRLEAAAPGGAIPNQAPMDDAYGTTTWPLGVAP